VLGQETAALDDDALLERLSIISAVESVLAAAKTDTMVAFHCALSGPSADLGHDRPRPGDRPARPSERRWSGDVLRSVTDEIGLVLGAHRRTAARWLNRAVVLVERFPTTHALLGAGGLPASAAQSIAHELACITDDELRAAVEAVVLAWGQRYGWARIKQVAQREAAKVQAEYDSMMHAMLLDERTPSGEQTPAGEQTSPAGEQTRGGESTLCGDERPARDETAGDAPGASSAGGAAQVQVVIHCTAAEAEALATGEITTGGELEGYGPLPQDALALAFRKAKFRYRLTDASPISDPERHDPSPGLAQHVRDRDRWCVVPGCTEPAVRCDLDHRVPFPDGRTTAANLESRCRHHHRLKHLGNWRVFVTEDRTVILISPTGRAYLTPPALPNAA
jgi:hypothetical protein